MNKNKYYKSVEYNTFYEMLNNLYKKHSKKIAIKFFNKKELVNITYNKLIKEVSTLYNYLKNNEISNKNIGIISENRYEYITIYLSSVFDNVIAPIDKEITVDSLKFLLKKFDIEVLFYTTKMKEIVLPATEASLIKTINIDKEYQNILKNEYSLDLFFNSIKNIKKNKFSVLAFTSGATGDIKGVMLSQYNILSNLRAALENNILKTPTLAILPMNHTYGFNSGVLNTLYKGNTLCLNLNLKHIVRDLKYFNPYFIAVVPMMAEGIYKNIIREAKRTNKYDMLQKMIKISNFLLKLKIDIRHLLFGNILSKRLKIIVSGGANLNPFYVEKFSELGIDLLNGYGLTECSPLVAVNRKIYNVPGSVGIIIKDDKVKIASDGEILVKGPNVMLGYYKDLQATKECMQNGYYKTGDFGHKKGNVLYVTGRKKNLIILENGKNFSPELIENKLLSLPYIKECIITTKKVKKNSLVIAKIYLKEKNNDLEKDLQKINETLPSYMQIDDYEVVDKEFEKTSTKKIIRSKYVK